MAALPHLAAATLEDYSLHNLTPKELEAAEHHLLICPTCCERLAGIEPFNVVHCTEEGLFYSRVTRLRNGSFVARHWGCQMDGGRGYPDLASACKYLLESFAQMFPAHRCGEACGGTSLSTKGPVS